MRIWQTKVDGAAPSAEGRLPAEEDNVRGVELNNTAISAGFTLDPISGPDTNQSMLAESLARYASGALWFLDDGSGSGTDEYTLVNLLGQGFVKPQALFDGMMICFVATFENTGAATVNLPVIGSVPLNRALTNNPLPAGLVTVGNVVAAAYDLANASFKILPWCELSLLDTSTVPKSPNLPMFFYTADGTQNFPHGTPTVVNYVTLQRANSEGASSFSGTTLTVDAIDSGLWVVLAGIDFRGAGAAGGLVGLDHQIFQVGTATPVAVDNRTSGTAANLGSVITHIQLCTGGEQFFVQNACGIAAGTGNAQPNLTATRFAAIKISV